MKTPKSIKRTPEAHVSNTKMPMGDYYGTGIKQKVGRIREDYMGTTPISNKKMGKPPKALA
jgi:hypothetical protein